MSEPRGPVYLTLPREVLADPAPSRAATTCARSASLAPEPARARHRGGRGADRQGRVPADRDLERRARSGGGGRARRARRRIRDAGGAGRGARLQPADRPSHASRLRGRRVAAEGRRGDRDRQRGAVDAARAAAAQATPRSSTSRPTRSTHALSVPEIEADLLVAGSIPARRCSMLREALGDAMQRQERRAIESRRKTVAAAREEIAAKRKKLIETVKDQSPIHPAWLAHCINQVKIRGRDRHQRARRAAADARSDEPRSLHGRAALGRPRLRPGRRRSAPSSRRRSAR